MNKRIPFFVTVLGMALGVAISIIFGINEGIIKNRIAFSLSQNQKINKIADDAERTKVLEKEKQKNWRYYQRFHFHSTGIGAMSLPCLLLLMFISAPYALKVVTSYMISVGGFLYPFVWLFAGIYGPIIGREAAKDKFAFFGYMGGVYFLGLLLLLYIISKYKFICFNSFSVKKT